MAPRANASKDKTRVAIVGMVALAIVVVVFILRPKPVPPICAFSGYKQSAGFDLSVKLKDTELIKGKVGMNDEQIRDFDTLLKDYAVRYDAACRDVRATPPLMSVAEYTCRRRNMDMTLVAIRTFGLAVDAIKNGDLDLESRKKEIFVALEALRKGTAANYDGGCTSAMAVNPSKITYPGIELERSIEIVNVGNNAFHFSLIGLTEAFMASQLAGEVAQGQSTTVKIVRLPRPGPQHVTFRVKSNLLDELPVDIELEKSTAEFYEELLRQLPATDRASVERNTLSFVARAVSDQAPNSAVIQHAVAGTIFEQTGHYDLALRAFGQALALDPQSIRKEDLAAARRMESLQQFQAAISPRPRPIG